MKLIRSFSPQHCPGAALNRQKTLNFSIGSAETAPTSPILRQERASDVSRRARMFTALATAATLGLVKVIG